MSLNRIIERIPSAKVVGIGILKKHQLKFHKISIKDGSGKCNIYENGEAGSEVFGVVFDIDENEKRLLDKAEGLGSGYEQKEIEVYLSNGEKIKVFTYYATNIDESLKPYSWYREHVVRGAKENYLPEDYIFAIESTEAVEDPVRSRHEKELSIY